jgi:hypothetical protein
MKDLYMALIKARSAFKPVLKNKVNPHFKNRYADLDCILEAVELPLAQCGLFITHQTIISDVFSLKTSLIHAPSEQELVCFYPLPEGAKPQELGSAITYARRYSISSLLGITAEDDDDANVANANPNSTKPSTPVAAKKTIY